MFYNDLMGWLGTITVVGSFTALFLLERRRPLRRELQPKKESTARNLAIAATAGLAIGLLEKPVADRLTRLVERRRLGLLRLRPLPGPVETALAVILLDYTLYFWHILTHRVPFLWRFHRVHHADLDLTASTALRFHFGEMVISVVFRAGQILLIGVGPRALAIWQQALFLSILFHHSNVRLPKTFEKWLQRLVVTPRLHGIHHSIVEEERNTNWSSGLTIWDFLHGTFRDDVRQEEITIGIAELDSVEDVKLGKMLFGPFLPPEKTERLMIEHLPADQTRPASSDADNKNSLF